MTATMNNAAVWVPINFFKQKYTGIPITAAPLKQIICRLVRFKATLVLIPFKSFGTGTDIAICFSFPQIYGWA